MLLAIGIYHASTFIQSGSEVMKSVYHIAHNTVILSLMYLVFSEIKNVRKFKLQAKVLKIVSVYFIYKIIINALYMFDWFVKFIAKYDMHVWSFMLTLLIIITLIIVKYTKR